MLTQATEPIMDGGLAGSIFSTTQHEYNLTDKLGYKFRFLFVVVSSANAYGKPFAVLLTLPELVHRTRAKRIQSGQISGTPKTPYARTVT